MTWDTMLPCKLFTTVLKCLGNMKLTLNVYDKTNTISDISRLFFVLFFCYSSPPAKKGESHHKLKSSYAYRLCLKARYLTQESHYREQDANSRSGEGNSWESPSVQARAGEGRGVEGKRGEMEPGEGELRKWS